ncbi:MAG: amino acid ABC transporter ATP-binding protein [Bacilli bacterium]
MLEARNVYKKFGDKTVLKNVNINIEKGETVLIIGPSGSGKTTILKCLNLLITPDKGEIIFKNEKLTSENINKIREKVGMVFQSFNLFPHLTILKNLTLVPVKKKLMTEKEANKKAKELLKKFGILDKQNEYPDNLSGGQKQRVAITRALMMNPEILLFDEPTSALDPEMVDEVFDSIEMLSKSGMTIVIVSHEMKFIKRLNPKIIFINKGKVEKIGTYEECLQDKENESLSAFLKKIDNK